MSAAAVAVRPGGGRVNSAAVAVRAVGVVAGRDLYRLVGQPGMLATQGLQMLFFLLVYAIGFNGMIGSVGDVPFSAYVFPGILAIQVVSTGVNTGMSFAWDRRFGFLREMEVAPVPRWSLPLGKAAGTTVIGTAQSAVLLAFAPIAGVHLTPLSALLGLVVCAATAAVFCGVGLVLALLFTRIEVLQGAVQLAMFPLLFLSGSIFRPDQAPGWLSSAMYANPMSYCVDLLRQVLINMPGGKVPVLMPAWADLLALAVPAVVLVVAIRWRSGR
ncbi:ABC transporter permease [Streptomyces sp. NPDC048442]|uniref:ABC transporter permease n=1 Tax=Streptomyces sp. NPDC048442 TaxID=3154823 RepID=UPI003420E95F